MARPREFDGDLVLDQVMRLFWQQGYQATSLDDLMRATGLSKQSIYGAFGGKRALFLKALELYRCQRLPALRAQLKEARSAKAAIASAIRAAAEHNASDDCPLGCLMANTALELGTQDAEIVAEVRKMMSGYERILAETIERAQRSGEITTKLKSEVIAQTLRSSLDGVAVLQKVGAPQKNIRAVVEALLEMIAA
ncbi:MAG TPA: helix-turn-helix domain-containing protein [Polyangiaceae bacterium]|nr:helix-turn-helix domain-containing protein [Polyangiaceae bacterium]